MNKEEYIKFVNKIMNDKSLEIEVPDNISISLNFNNDCNCCCKFCFEGSKITRNQKNRSLIPEKLLYEYFLSIYPKVSVLIPTYGEITVCNEGYDYLRFLNEKFHHINILINTNGIAIDDKWMNLAIENLMRVHFSINAINEEYFRKTVWNKDGVYQIVQNNFNKYLDILKTNDLFAFKPSVSCVINSTNYDTVVEFIKQYVSKGIQIIYFYFDIMENGVEQFQEESDEVYETLITLVEIQRILKGKVIMPIDIFAPTQNLKHYYDNANAQNINYLRSKYSEIIEITDSLPDIESLHKERELKRKENGKISLLLYEEATGVFRPQEYNGGTICGNPYRSIDLKPNGDISICCSFPVGDNIQKYIKDNTIDWKSLFNSFYYRNLRYNFQKQNYNGCLLNCPGKKNVNYNEYNNIFIGD